MTKIVFSGILAFLFFYMISCSSEKDDLLVGTWKFSDIEEIKKDTIQGMSPTDIEMMKKQATYVFKRNKTYKLHLVNFVDQGSWYMSEGGSALNMRSEKNDAIGRAIIRELTDEKLVIVIQINPAYQQVLHLEKLYH